MRVAGFSFPALLVLVLGSPAGAAGELRVAAWNLEHLDDSDGDGRPCGPPCPGGSTGTPPRGFAPRSAGCYTKPRGSTLLTTGTTSAVPFRGSILHADRGSILHAD